MDRDTEVPKFLEELNRFMTSWYPYLISLLVAIISGIRIYMAGPRCPSVNRVENKIIVITGGSSGIGFETAKELAVRGASIVLVCRNEDKGQRAVRALKKEIPMATVILKIVDLSLMSSIKQFAREMELQFDCIDVLINNVGIIFQPQSQTSEGFEITFATNYFGPFLLSHLLLPLLSKSCNGRIVNLTALAHFSVCLSLDDIKKNGFYKSKEVFAQSKLALMMFTKHMGRICRNVKVTVNAVNPGLVRNTQHFDNSSLASNFFTKLSIWPWAWMFMKTPNQGCQTVVYCAIDPTLDVTTGAYFSDCAQRDSAPVTKNHKFAADLYKRTCEILEIDSKKLIDELTQPI